MYPTLTKRQKEILDYIKVYSELNGYAPSLVDIKKHFNLSAISTVHEHIQNLKVKGYIHKEMNQARSVRPISPKLGANGLAEIPVLGEIGEHGFVETKGRANTVILHESILARPGSYFAMRVATNALLPELFRQGDLVIFLEQEQAKDGELVLAETDAGKSVFARHVSSKGKSMLEHLTLGHEAVLYKNITVMGTALTVIRSLV